MIFHKKTRGLALLLCLLMLLGTLSTVMAEGEPSSYQTAETEIEAETPILNLPSALAIQTFAATTYTVEKANTNGTFTQLESYTSFDTAKASMTAMGKAEKTKPASASYVVRTGGRVVAMTGGIAAATNAVNSTLSFDNTYGGARPYVVGRTVMYYEETVSPGEVWVGISGVRACTKYQNLLLIPAPFMTEYADSSFSQTNSYQIDYYSRSSTDDLFHTVASLTDPNGSKQYESGEKTTLAGFTMDRAPSFMESGKKYYSMDGVNYYADPLLSQLVGTHYPYFQYLSYHSQTECTTAELNAHLKATRSSSSVLLNNASAFTAAEKDYGINALLELAYACHESAGGTTNYAVNRFNLFGIAAFDSNPDNATYFESVQDCVAYHAERIVKQGYLDALTDSRYFGPNPGNKATGINVRYASDPFHGQKVGGWAYRMDKAMGSKDYGKYAIGLAATSAPVYAAPDGQTVLYSMRNTSSNADLTGLPLVVLGKEGDYYKVQSDMPIVQNNKNETCKSKGHPDAQHACCYGTYSFAHVGYIREDQLVVLDTAVKPTKPTKPAATSSGATSLKLTWTEGVGAGGYEIWFSETKSGQYQMIGSTEKTTYTHSKLTVGTTYYYKLRSYRVVGDQTRYSGYTAVFSGITKPGKVSNVKAVPPTFKSIKLTWGKESVANTYTIQRSQSKTSGFKTIATVTKVSYTDKALDTHTTYYYRIRASMTVDGKQLHGSYSNVVSAKPKNVLPSAFTVTSGGKTIMNISWKKVSGAAGYRLYRRNLTTNKLEILADLKSSQTTYRDRGLTAGTTYTYRVRAFATINKKKVWGKLTPDQSAATKPEKTLGLTAAATGFTSAQLSWESVEGADGYMVRRSLTNPGGFKTIADVTEGTSFEDLGLSPEATYYYNVRAYKMSGGKKLYGAYAGVVSAELQTVTPAKPKLTVLSDTSCRISWKAVKEATGYALFKYNTDTKKYQTVTMLGANARSYVDETADTTVALSYKVRPYILINEQTIWGKATEAITNVPTPTKTVGLTLTVSKKNVLTVKYDEVADATGYEVVVSDTKAFTTSESKTYKGFGQNQISKFGGKSLNVGTTYYVKVRAYGTGPDGGRIWGKYSSLKKLKIPTPEPTRPTLRRGSTGNNVKIMQQKLKDAGYAVTVDGLFGPGTERALIAFQKAKKLTADGVCGPTTWAKLG